MMRQKQYAPPKQHTPAEHLWVKAGSKGVAPEAAEGFSVAVGACTPAQHAREGHVEGWKKNKRPAGMQTGQAVLCFIYRV